MKGGLDTGEFFEAFGLGQGHLADAADAADVGDAAGAGFDQVARGQVTGAEAVGDDGGHLGAVWGVADAQGWTVQVAHGLEVGLVVAAHGDHGATE